MSLTRLLRPIFCRRAVTALRAASATADTQERVLADLLRRARHTEAGRRYGFADISSYDVFAARVPVVDYADIRPDVERMIAGERDVLWPGLTRRFAQSSGTSDGKSKYVPVTDDSLRLNHYRGASDALSFYLLRHPESRVFDGRSFILGGSFANELTLPAGVKVGDLSAHLIECINPLVNLVRIPSRKVALMSDWTAKLPLLVESSRRANVTNISGVPSWFLTVLKEVTAAAGASTIHDVWPRLEVFFHGGIAFDPYREQYRHITDPSRMHYVETYNASEGFFGAQDDPADLSMLLLTDIGVFYEFIPFDSNGRRHDRPIPASEVKPGHTYALVITSCNGLWRYRIGDTVTVTSVNPLKFIIAGRTKHFINAFGEELMVHNADAALASTCAALDCDVANYTAAPVYAGDRTPGRHEWLIEFNRAPADMEQFADTLDAALQSVNSDYQAKRSGGIFLDRLTVVPARQGLFDAWLASTGKLGGQRKVPRLSNDRRFIDAMLAFN